jgi:glycosyltransferase involved in cell wall biosynthesis
MPCYLVEAYIKAALDCIQAQAFADWELIVVDDCSPDGSIGIAEGYAQGDARIRIVRHSVNRGLAAARNTGIAEARGSYVWFTDPDDTYEATLLEDAYGSLRRNPARAVLFGQCLEFFNEEGRFLYEQAMCLKPQTYRCAADLRPAILALEQGTHYGYATNKVYDLAYLKNKAISFKDLALIEDILFNIEFFQDADSLNVLGTTPYRYAKRLGKNLTNAYRADYFELHRLRIERLMQQQESWGVLTDDARALLGGLFARYILSALERNASPESGMDGAKRRAWCKNLFTDPLFGKLIPYARASHSTSLALCIGILRSRNAFASTTLGGFIHFMRSRFFSLFSRFRAGR